MQVQRREILIQIIISNTAYISIIWNNYFWHLLKNYYFK